MLIIFQPFYSKGKSVWTVLANVFILLFEGAGVYLLVRRFATGEFADGYFKAWMAVGFSCAFLLVNYILRAFCNLYHRISFCKVRHEEFLLRGRDAYDPYPERLHLGAQIDGLSWEQKKQIQLDFLRSLGEYDEKERLFDPWDRR